MAASLNAPLVYGQGFSGTWSEFPTPPRPSVSITDGGLTITLPVTIIDNGGGTGTFSGTFPALPPAGDSSGPGTVLHPTLAAQVTLTESGV